MRTAVDHPHHDAVRSGIEARADADHDDSSAVEMIEHRFERDRRSVPSLAELDVVPVYQLVQHRDETTVSL